jgi:hypothetical protein
MSLKKFEVTQEGQDRILKHIHNMRLKVFEERQRTGYDLQVKPHLPTVAMDEKELILEKFEESKGLIGSKFADIKIN